MKKKILDVRKYHEYPKIEDSLNIPLGELLNNISTLDRNTKYLVHCASGMRSAQAAALLREKGFEVEDLGSLQNAQSYLRRNGL